MLEAVSKKPFYATSLKGLQSSIHLDFLRCLAALQVFISHSRTLFFADYEQIKNPNLLLKAFYFLTGLGHESVIVFFVLSGFFIAASVIKSVRNDKWSWNQYLINRLSRLCVVLIPALLLSYGWDSLGMSIFGTGATSPYGGKLLEHSQVTYQISERLNLANLFGNLFFLNGILVDRFGSSAPIWSLTYEFWYYMLFPCLLLIFSSRLSRQQRILYGLLAVLIFLGIGGKISLYFLIWLMGAAVCIAYPSQVVKQRRLFYLLLLLTCLGFAVTLVISRFDILKEPSSDFLIGIASAMVVYLLLHDQTPANHPGLYASFSQKIAAFSYTLYLLHLPLLGFMRACLVQGDRWQPSLLHLGLWLAACGLVLLYAFLVAQVTEAKTDQVRRALLSWRFSTSSTQ